MGGKGNVSVYMHSLLTLNGIASYLYLCIYENILLCNNYHKKDFQDEYSWNFECCGYSCFCLGLFHSLNIGLISSLLIQL